MYYAVLDKREKVRITDVELGPHAWHILLDAGAGAVSQETLVLDGPEASAVRQQQSQEQAHQVHAVPVTANDSQEAEELRIAHESGALRAAMSHDPALHGVGVFGNATVMTAEQFLRATSNSNAPQQVAGTNQRGMQSQVSGNNNACRLQ
jgi:hypothetical protein